MAVALPPLSDRYEFKCPETPSKKKLKSLDIFPKGVGTPPRRTKIVISSPSKTMEELSKPSAYYLNQAKESFIIKSYNEALEQTEKALSLQHSQEEEISILKLRASSFFKMKQYHSSAKEYEKIIQIEGYKTKELNMLLCIYLKHKQYNRIFLIAAKMLEAHPGSGTILRCRGIAYFETKQFKLAIQDLTEAYSTRLNDHKLIKVLTQAWIDINNVAGLEKAHFYASMLRKHFPEDAEAAILLGEVFRFQKKYQEAAKEYGEAFRLDPSREDHNKWMGQLYYDMESFREALKCFNAYKAIKYDLHFLALRADLHRRLKNYSEALRDINFCLRQQPERLLFLEIKGTLYSDNQEWANARHCFRKILSLKPEDPSALQALSEINENARNSPKENQLKLPPLAKR